MFRLFPLVFLLSACTQPTTRSKTAPAPPHPNRDSARPATLPNGPRAVVAAQNRKAAVLVKALVDEVPRWEKISVPTQLTKEAFVQVFKQIQPRIDEERRLMQQTKPLALALVNRLEATPVTRAACLAGVGAQRLMEAVVTYYQVRNKTMARFWDFSARFNQRL